MPVSTPTRGSAFLAVTLLVVAAGGGHVATSRPVVEYGQQLFDTADHPHGDVPAAATGPPPETDALHADFRRVERDNQVFAFESHDPMLAAANGTHYLVVGTGDDPALYRSDAPAEPDRWRLVDGDYLADRFEFDSLIRVGDRYVAYGNGDVYTARSLTATDWTVRNDNTGFRDLGAYYDERTGLVHVYYEYGHAAGYSGKKIGHAVSPNGVTNWTVYPPVWTAPDGYGVGDFDVVERDGRLYLFGDYDPHHPRYNVSRWVNDDPYSTFAQLDDPAVARPAPTAAADGYGVGDPSVLRLDGGRYLMLANGYASESSPARLHAYVGTISNQTGPAEADPEPSTAPRLRGVAR